jgi:hypothetical protein
MLGDTNSQQLHYWCRLITVGVQLRLLTSWNEYVQQCYGMYAYVTKWFTSRWKCTQMTLGISKLRNIFHLHIEM